MAETFGDYVSVFKPEIKNVAEEEKMLCAVLDLVKPLHNSVFALLAALFIGHPEVKIGGEKNIALDRDGVFKKCWHGRFLFRRAKVAKYWRQTNFVRQLLTANKLVFLQPLTKDSQMDDIIHLLPDRVANQIAAGEVVQRPASAVKELLENAIDAGASHIQLVVKDAGRTLIQVIDDGKGMSFNDARLCFERHATSKISSAEDLFSIRTKGFRGEALASVAAIAHVELKTKRAEDETGTLVQIEGSEIKEHTLTTTADGTSISVKNLFFNVPARRNFLKSDATEFGCIEEEFKRVALIHPEVAFTLYHNGNMVYQLKSNNPKLRIVELFGKHFNDKLYPLQQESNYIKISGFIGKPECSKKKSPEQYLFVNHRFVKHRGLNFAVESAYSQVLPEGHHPVYFISIEVDPATIDVNISPTKIDVKLQDERMAFGFLNASVRKAIGEFSLIPQLDFDYNTELDLNSVPEKAELKVPTIEIDKTYNPFRRTQSSNGGGGRVLMGNRPQTAAPDWDNFLRDIHETQVQTVPSEPEQTSIDFQNEDEILVKEGSYLILYQKYMLVKIQEKPHLIHIARAYERIIYQSYMEALREKPVVVQQSLFPETITLTPARAELLQEIREDMHKLGYDIEPISGGNFAVNGTPNEEDMGDVQTLVECLLDDYQSQMLNHRMEREKSIAMSMARQKRSRKKVPSTPEEAEFFLRQLFACLMPTISPSGKKIYEVLEEDALTKILS